MIAVFKREFRAFFQSVTGCLFIAVNLLFLGIYFTAFNLSSGYMYLSYAIRSTMFVFLIMTPILTMRILSEERRQKTDQLLLTSPVSIFRIVLGKYFSMICVFAIPVLILSIYPFVLRSFGKIPYAESYIAVLGYFLFGCSCIAIGLFVSSITENQIIAAVITFAILLLSYIMNGISSLISSVGNLFTRALQWLDMGQRLDNMMQGILDLNAVVYFLSVIVLFLFLTYESIQKRRYSISSKNIQITAYSQITIVVVLAIAIVVNIVVNEVPESITKVDATNEKIYSITDQTKEMLQSLKEDVTIYVLAKEDNSDTTVGETLNKYHDLSKHVKVEYKDPTLNPNFASEYNASDATAGSLIVVGQKRNKVIPYMDLYQIDMDYQTGQQKTTGYDAEGQITSAIAYVTSNEMPKIYCITGHNEATLTTRLKSSITKENIETEDLSLLSCESIPEDASAICIVSPTKDFSEEDTKKVKDYLKKGGKALLLSSYVKDPMPNFNSIMNDYGVKLVDGLVVEQDQSHYYQNPFYLIPTVSVGNDVTSSISDQNRYVFLPYAQGLEVEENQREGLTVTKLLQSSETSYAKKDLSENASMEKSAEDVEGPFALGVYVQEKVEDGETGIVYFTTESMLEDTIDEAVSGSNTEMVMNALSMMVDHEVTVSVPVKSYEQSNLMIPRSAMAIWSLVVTILLPAAFLILGFVLWFRRRRK